MEIIDNIAIDLAWYNSVLLNIFCHLDFGFVSDFDIRISNLTA